jgi:hypothetical protein
MPSLPVLLGKFVPYRLLVVRDSICLTCWLECSGIGLETSILFAKEGANVMMADISAPALEKAQAKLKQLVPNASKVETLVNIT